MINTNKCWTCSSCLHSLVRVGAELKKGNNGNCLEKSSPINIGKAAFSQMTTETIVTNCKCYNPKKTKQSPTPL